MRVGCRYRLAVWILKAYYYFDTDNELLESLLNVVYIYTISEDEKRQKKDVDLCSGIGDSIHMINKAYTNSYAASLAAYKADNAKKAVLTFAEYQLQKSTVHETARMQEMARVNGISIEAAMVAVMLNSGAIEVSSESKSILADVNKFVGALERVAKLHADPTDAEIDAAIKR